MIFCDYSGNCKIAIIFDDTTSLKDRGWAFYCAASIAYSYNSLFTKAVTFGFHSATKFVEIWNSLDDTYDSVIIICHGYQGGGGIWCRDGDIGFNSGIHTYTYQFSDLKSHNFNGPVYLYVCHAAQPDINGNSVAQAFADLSNNYSYGAVGNVSQTIIGAWPSDFGDWHEYSPTMNNQSSVVSPVSRLIMVVPA